MKGIVWSLRFLSQYRFLILLGVLAAFIAGCAYSIYPWTLKILLDDVISKQNIGLLLPITLALLGTVIVSSSMELVQTYIFTKSAQGAINRIRSKLFTRMLQLPISFIREKSPGELLSYYVNDINQINVIYTSFITGTVASLTQIILQFGFLFYMNVPLTLLTILFIPLYFFNHKYFKKTISSSADDMQKSNDNSIQLLQEGLTNIREVKIYDANRSMSNKLKVAFQDVLTKSVRNTLLTESNFHLSNVITFGTRYIIYGFGAYLTLTGSMTMGELIAFVTFQTTLFNPIARFLNIVSKVHNAEVITGRLLTFFKDTEDMIEKSGSVKRDLQGHFTLKDVTYQYPNKVDPVLQKISLEIKPARITAIVGPSGGGKTTLFHIIAGYYGVEKGIVEVDGIALKDLDLSCFRSQVGVVFQDIVLFNTSVKDNIKLSKPDATDEEVIYAAKLAFSHDFIQNLPDQYETLVGNNGVKLSGGQRQRIALARVFLQNPKILILDEPTSALDSESETEIHTALNHLMEDRTTIIVTHNMAIASKADHIIFIHQGKVIEQGSHQELVNHDGIYVKLFNNQRSEYVSM
ncbi:subfamily B ATP-binding cassette protein MsbA [Croceifilum oryzae]|uniref:Subfamily B ATP-binding cassette protein MsbA n=1 Tax=Croceifilum oryzae TaxID=1553429 RepID=A0AAJ1WTF0_9BACL|nr:ABC transporter ATP-binding protein [Croceifilum oryzae]MDQ0417973.1 subfamily B ATP-binding cassette protein MsbA [Croceifilum oryzae]